MVHYLWWPVSCMAMWRECWTSGIKNKTPSAASTVLLEALAAHYPKEPTFLVSICANHDSSVRLTHFALTSRLAKSSWPLLPLSVSFQPDVETIQFPLTSRRLLDTEMGRQAILGNKAMIAEETSQRYYPHTHTLLQPASPPLYLYLLLLSISCTPPNWPLDGKLGRGLLIWPSAVPWSVLPHLSPSLRLWYPGEMDQQVSNLGVHLMHWIKHYSQINGAVLSEQPFSSVLNFHGYFPKNKYIVNNWGKRAHVNLPVF